MKRISMIFLIVCLLATMLCGCTGGQYESDAGYDYEQDDVKDWMQDNAEGKDYDYDDGGSYYCMGKGDTCPRKTNNAYDLYCSSCDPDGDNVEG